MIKNILSVQVYVNLRFKTLLRIYEHIAFLKLISYKFSSKPNNFLSETTLKTERMVAQKYRQAKRKRSLKLMNAFYWIAILHLKNIFSIVLQDQLIYTSDIVKQKKKKKKNACFQYYQPTDLYQL